MNGHSEKMVYDFGWYNTVLSHTLSLQSGYSRPEALNSCSESDLYSESFCLGLVLVLRNQPVCRAFGALIPTMGPRTHSPIKPGYPPQMAFTDAIHSLRARVL